MDHLTVDMICEASDVSARTFFNYFGSKEGALLGAAPTPPSQEDIDAFLAGTGTALEDLMALMAATFISNHPDIELWSMRRELYGREPILHAAQLSRVADKRERLAAIVADRLCAADPQLSREAAEQEVHLVHGIAITAFQQLGREWIAAGDATPDIHSLVDAALQRVRRIVCPGA